MSSLKAIEDLGTTLEATLFVDGPTRESTQAIREILLKGRCLKINAIE